MCARPLIRSVEEIMRCPGARIAPITRSGTRRQTRGELVGIVGIGHFLQVISSLTCTSCERQVENV
jgi:hypothetical protein